MVFSCSPQEDMWDEDEDDDFSLSEAIRLCQEEREEEEITTGLTEVKYLIIYQFYVNNNVQLEYIWYYTYAV